MLQSIPTTFEFDAMSIVNPRIKSSKSDDEEEELQSSPIKNNKEQNNTANDIIPERNNPFIIISNDSFDDSHGNNNDMLDKTIDRIMEINEKNSLEDIKHFKEIINETNNNDLPIFDNYDYEIDSAEFFDDICGNSFSDSDYETENDRARLEFRNPELSDENLITSSSSDRSTTSSGISSSNASASDSDNESGSDVSSKVIDDETMEIYDELERLFTTRDEQVVKDTIELLKSQILPKLNILKDDANKYHELKKIFRLPSVTNLALLSNQYKKTNKKRYNIDMENELFNDEFVFHTITSKDKFNSKIQFKNEFDEFKKKNSTRSNNDETIPKKSKKQRLPENEVKPVVINKPTTSNAKKQKNDAAAAAAKHKRRHSLKIPNLDTLGEVDDEFSIHDGITIEDGGKEIARAISIVKPQEKVLIVNSKNSDDSLNSFDNLENQVKSLTIGEKSENNSNSSNSSTTSSPNPSCDSDTNSGCNFLQVSPIDSSQVDENKYFKEFDGNFGEESENQFQTGVKLIEIPMARRPSPVVQTVKSVKSYEAVATIESDVTAETIQTTNETIVEHHKTFVCGLENDTETIFSSNETIYNGSSIMSQETMDDDSNIETLTIILESKFVHSATPRQQSSCGSLNSSLSPAASTISASSTSSTSNTSVSTDTAPAPNCKTFGQDMYYAKPLPIPAAAPTTATAASVMYMSSNSVKSRPNSPKRVRSLMKPFVSSTANTMKINPTIGSSSAPSSSSPPPSSRMTYSGSHPYAPHRSMSTRSRSGSHATSVHNRNNSIATSPEVRNYSKKHDRNKDKRRIFSLTRKELDELRCELAYNLLPELNSSNTNSNNYNESKSIKPIVSFFENFRSKNNNNSGNTNNTISRSSLGARKNEFDLDSNNYNIFRKPRFYESPICQLTNNQIEICIEYTLSRTLSSSYRF